jgi:hypothetical protein
MGAAALKFGGKRISIIESLILILIPAFVLGIAHAFEPDHMAAVSTFVASRPRPREAVSFGLKWATGHGLVLLLLGSILFLLSRAVEENQPSLFSSGILERVVGFVLILLGINALLRLVLGDAMPRTLKGWKALFRGQRLPSRSLEQQLVEQQKTTRTTDLASQTDEMPLFGRPDAVATRAAIPGETPRAVTNSFANSLWGGSVLMGLLHGAAGTGAFIGQAMIAMSRNYSSALLFTLFFSLGVLLAMAFYSVLLGGVLTWGEKRSVSLLRGARALTGALTCAIGACLLLGVELPGLFDRFVH